MKSKVLLGMTLVAMGAAVSLMSGCHVRGATYGQAWYDVYGFHCGNGQPRPGCNFYADGSKIMDFEDPYYGPGNMIVFGSWVYTDSYGYTKFYTGWGWQSSTGILYDDWGYALNESQEQEGRDLISDAAQEEQAVVTKVGKLFAEKYALADDTGVQIARTLNDWATLSKKQGRARTDADVADFSKRLYGVSMEQTQAALELAKTGDQSGLESVNSDVAKFWGTNPETSRTILKKWYKDQLGEYGVK